jgi:cyclic pyranopterin phosphate synthase
MVDVTSKKVVERYARARAEIRLKKETLQRIRQGTVPKGDVLATAQIAGIQAAKQTSFIIPLCHPIRLTQVEINFKFTDSPNRIEIQSEVKGVDRTGVEMEALMAVAAAALSIYDMCKGIDSQMCIREIRLEEKRKEEK